MTKHFCDRCGAACLPMRDNRLIHDWSEPLGHGYPKDPDVRVVISLHIGLTNHPTGFGGPPDLCPACLAEALAACLPR